MSAIPHTNLDPFFADKPIVITTTVQFEASAPISAGGAAPAMTAQIWTGSATPVAGTIDSTAWPTVKMTFPAQSGGFWQGSLEYSEDMLGTFSFPVA